MSECRYYEICDLPVFDSRAGLCILHSHLHDKPVDEFKNALKKHRETRGDRFAHMVFPEGVNFSGAIFSELADFGGATFSGVADFSGVTFAEQADFGTAVPKQATTFTKRADFRGTAFLKDADFRHAVFTERVDFSVVTFSEAVDFSGATFTERATFRGTTFCGRAAFRDVTFSGEAYFTENFFASDITFLGSHFHGRTMFTPSRVGAQNRSVFSADITVDFRDVVLESPESLSFRHADFRTCRFLNTDLRKAELTGVIWPKNHGQGRKKGSRDVVYDEIAPYRPEESYPWNELERLYRELKQNYDERRNYPRVGNFHYGEKEMQRHNPATPLSLKVFLWLYWLVSGYGERFRRPLLCALVLLIGATVAYLLCGLVPKSSLLSTKPETTAFLVLPGAAIREAPPAPLPITQPNSWLSALHYSFRVMTLLKPEDLEPMGFAKVVQTLESLLGPLFLGLFALAVRQRLKH